MKSTNAEPVLVWTGNKNKLSNTIIEKFPSYINTYYEPFLGGGSIFCSLINQVNNGDKDVDTFQLNDINTGLISLYHNIKYNVDTLVDKIEYYCETFNACQSGNSVKNISIFENDTIDDCRDKPHLYNFYRFRYNEMKNDFGNVDMAALFYILNKTCQRGLYRENKKGQFNTSFNYTKNLNPKIDKILDLNDIFNSFNVNFTCMDIFEFMERPFNQDDLVYMDPPYVPTRQKYFTSYSHDLFLNGNEKLIQLCDNLNKNNIKFIQSNSYCKYIVNNYKKYNIHPISNGNKNIKEVLISNFE